MNIVWTASKLETFEYGIRRRLRRYGRTASPGCKDRTATTARAAKQRRHHEEGIEPEHIDGMKVEYLFCDNNSISLVDILGLKFSNGYATWKLVRKYDGTKLISCNASSIGSKTNKTYTYSLLIYSLEIGILDNHMFDNIGGKIVVFVLTDINKVGSLLKKAVAYGGSGQVLLRKYEREDKRIITAQFICVCDKGKTYWKTTRLGEKIIIGNDKLDDVEVIDKKGIEDMGPEKFIKQLWEHVIGGIS